MSVTMDASPSWRPSWSYSGVASTSARKVVPSKRRIGCRNRIGRSSVAEAWRARAFSSSSGSRKVATGAPSSWARLHDSSPAIRRLA